MVYLNLIRRPSSAPLLAIVIILLSKCDAFALTSLPSAPTLLDHVHHRTTTKQIFTKGNSASSLYGKWDDLVDEDDVREDSTIPRDMRYIGFNIQRQNRHFVDIRTAAGGPNPLTADIYARSPTSTTFFFVGKIARISDVTIERAVARQWGLIEQHAARLRPLELYKEWGNLELWCTGGDMEMDVAYHRPKAVFTRMEKVGVEGSEVVRNVEVGFQGEIYDSGEEGFRIERREDGTPARGELMPPEKRAPTDDEMKNIGKMFEGKDMGAIFDEQSKNSDTSL